MFAALLAYVFTAMVFWCPPRQNSIAQLGAYVRIAAAMARASDGSFRRATLLASIGSYESGYRGDRLGKLGEVGVWQLLPPPLGAPVPKGLDAQAREALRRWDVQGPCGYTGESATPKSACPLARHRIERADNWIATHPPSDTHERVTEGERGRGSDLLSYTGSRLAAGNVIAAP